MEQLARVLQPENFQPAPEHLGAASVPGGLKKVRTICSQTRKYLTIRYSQTKESIRSLVADDLAFQAHVLAEGAIKVRNLWVVLISDVYIRAGELRPKGLFIRHYVTDEVRSRVGSSKSALLNEQGERCP